MAQELTIDGKQYISSKRAAEISGYAQDYIGQLARSAQIDARRIGGLWYVLMESLRQYETEAAAYKPAPPNRVASPKDEQTETLISLDGHDYVSAARASEITGYNQDYVGQLARSGKVLARQIGTRWYIERESLLRHKAEKDALLASVQVEAVGLADYRERSKAEEPDQFQYMAYTRDDADLMPILRGVQDADLHAENRQQIPIRIIKSGEQPRFAAQSIVYAEKTVSSPRRTRTRAYTYGTFAAAALTIVIVLTIGFSSFRSAGVYTMTRELKTQGYGRALSAAAAATIDKLSAFFEGALVPELTYRRQDSR